MTRRGGQLPWSSRAGSPFEPSRGPNLMRLGLMAAIILALALLVVVVVARMLGGGCDEVYCPADFDATAPDGYQLVSKVYEYTGEQDAIPDDSSVQIEVALTEEVEDGSNLSFYRYSVEANTWEPLTAAVLGDEKNRVFGIFQEPPGAMAVLLRLSAAGHVAAYLDHNAVLHPDAVGRVSIVHTRDFQPSSDGTVEGQLSNFQPGQGVQWYPTISANASLQGSVANADAILSSSESRSSHVDAIMQLVQDNDLAGIDIAYHDLPADQRISFGLFVEELAQSLHNEGKILTLYLPPPTISDGTVDEGAYDWATLGAAADTIQLAAYRDQRTYRTDMPAILDHLKGLVEPSKLLLTVTPYATEWTQEGMRTLSLAEAMGIATQLRAPRGTDGRIETNTNVDIVAMNINRDEGLSGIQWDPNTATVSFTYKSDGNRVVWIENVFSVGFKLEFISRFQLGGVAVEDASDNVMLGNIWTALVPFIASGQPVLLQPNAQDLLPRWNESAGMLEGGQRGIATWTTPPEPGTYTVSLQLSDGVYLFENTISVDVVAREDGSSASADTAGQED